MGDLNKPATTFFQYFENLFMYCSDVIGKSIEDPDATLHVKMFV